MSNSAVIKRCIGVGQDIFPFISVLAGGEGLMEKGASPACVYLHISTAEGSS